MYYEILPEYHRFRTDFADKSSKLIFFEGYSFTIDSTNASFITQQARKVLLSSEDKPKANKYTDGSTYALFFGGESRHGNSNNYSSFEEFYLFLKVHFLDNYLHLRKPIMYN